MLPTFVIGLREGLEAALIVGIIAAFLRKQGRGDLLRQMALGVAVAVLICLAGGIALEIYSRNLPQQQQEGLETVIGILAVAMVTYMVIWMKEHSRGLKAELESMTAEAIDGPSRAGLAMVAMAFLAVLREGFETVVFLLAAFNETSSGSSAVIGAILGIAVAVALGYGIYRGGVRINLSKFFRATGLVLVLVAAGLVVSAIHTAHEAGWLDAGQNRMLNLSWLVRPGSVLSSLLTGMLGIQPYPVMAEVLGWLLYAVPIGVFVAWPPGRAVPLRALRTALAGVGVVGIAAGAVLATTAPSVSTPAAATGAGTLSVRITSAHGPLVVSAQEQFPLSKKAGAARSLRLTSSTSSTSSTSPTSTDTDGLNTTTYRVHLAGAKQTTELSSAKASALNLGRLPLGVVARHGVVAATLVTDRVATVVVEPLTRRVLSISWREVESALLTGSSGQSIPSAKPLAAATVATAPAATARAVTGARADLRTLDTRDHRLSQAWLLGLLGGAALLGLTLSVIPLGRPRAVTGAARTLART